MIVSRLAKYGCFYTDTLTCSLHWMTFGTTFDVKMITHITPERKRLRNNETTIDHFYSLGM